MCAAAGSSPLSQVDLFLGKAGLASMLPEAQRRQPVIRPEVCISGTRFQALLCFPRSRSGLSSRAVPSEPWPSTRGLRHPLRGPRAHHCGLSFHKSLGHEGVCGHCADLKRCGIKLAIF